MSVYNLPDYRNKYFEHKDLDKIYGQPNIVSICKLFKQGKRNAQCVPTTLGGGQTGYLFLYIEPATFLTIPGATAVIRPTDPGVFTPAAQNGIRAPPLTVAEIATQKLAHDESKRHYNEVQAVETALRKQITDAIEEEFLQPLRDPITDMIQCPIPNIFTFLRTTYGKLSAVQLKEKENDIDQLIYDPSCNVDTIFNKVQDFQDICVMIGNGKTDTQLVTYAYLIFQKTGIFMEGLKSWNAKPTADRTFVNFKMHMRSEYLDLQEVGGLTINNSTLSQVNLVKELKSHQEQMSNNLKEELKANLMQTLQAFSMAEDLENIDPNLNSPYCAPTNSMEQEKMMAAIRQQEDPQVTALKLQLELLQKQFLMLKTPSGTGQEGGTKDEGSTNQDINPKTGQSWKRYCWSCGCCGHWGKYCPNKKKGHKIEATFRNRMNGSSANCLG